MNDQLVEHLKTLHTHAIDARHGYEEALHDAEGRGLTPLFQDMIALHAKNADELAAELREAGQTADDKGSFMSSVHRTIMSVRSLFDGLGESVLPGLIDGETRNVSAYKDALQDIDIPAHVRSLLERQCDRIETEITRMRIARD